MTTAYADGKMLASVSDGIGTITINQPEKRNAMSVEMWVAMGEILGQFAEDDAVRVCVMTGAGDKAFISGADISQFDKVRANADAQKEYDKLTSSGRARLASFPKPLIAKIRGFCLGGGLGVAMQADMRIASEDSQFGIPAARLGIAYGFEVTRRLVSLVGPAHARGILMTAQRISAAEALRIGLINRMHPVEELDDAVAKIAATIVDNAPLSVRAAKLIIDQATRDPDKRDMDAIAAIMTACFDSADYREGRTAFMEKRKPVFAGH